MRYIDETEYTFEQLCTQLLDVTIARWDAQTEEVDEIYFGHIAAIQRLASKTVLERGLRWSNDESPAIRCLGVHVLSQIGRPIVAESGSEWKRFFQEMTAPVMLERLHDADDNVLVAAIYGAGHHELPDASVIAQFASHADPIVRKAVACALPSFQNATEERFTDLLIKLMQDESDDVRNWATFGLGLTGADSAEIRTALTSATNDSMSDVRGEAISALVQRNHPDARRLLLAELENNNVYAGIYDAAEELGDPTIIPALRAHEDRFGEYSTLTNAIEHLSQLTQGVSV